MTGFPKDAAKDLDECIKLNPGYLDGYFNRGQLRKEMGDKKGAMADFTKAAAMPASNPDTLTNRGMALMQLKRFTEALTDFNAAIEQNPRSIPAYRGRSLVYMQIGDINSAQKDIYMASQLREQMQTGRSPQTR
jgi:tetratricopeptide (TPR) repeat protein